MFHGKLSNNLTDSTAHTDLIIQYFICCKTRYTILHYKQGELLARVHIISKSQQAQF